jgi:hypothetical protein
LVCLFGTERFERDKSLAAVCLLAPSPYELAICNVLLPDGNGRDVASWAMKLGIKNVIVTGNPDAMQAMTLAAIPYLAKRRKQIRPFGKEGGLVSAKGRVKPRSPIGAESGRIFAARRLIFLQLPQSVFEIAPVDRPQKVLIIWDSVNPSLGVMTPHPRPRQRAALRRGPSGTTLALGRLDRVF